MARIGVISDTHGLLRPEAVAALAGVSHIVHAGDVGTADVLVQLRNIAPVTAVRGNNDNAAWAAGLATSGVLKVAGRAIYVLHDIADLHVDPAAAGYAVVVTGHSHKPMVTMNNGVLFMNPGSAGPRRFTLPVTLGTLDVSAHGVHAEIHELTLVASNTERSKVTAAANRGGWKTCPRGHKYRGAGSCPVCWKGKRAKHTAKARAR